MADEKANPISAAKPPITNPMASATASHAATLKLKPVIRKPGEGAVRPAVRPPAAPVTPAASSSKSSTAPLDALKGITQKLKGVTQAIPQQAILHKTGIIAEQDLTDAQKQAAKARTARISLSDAMGVAPVKNEAAPMKTIRIKRPVELSQAAAPAAEEPATADTSVTQRKTLKIARPGAAAARPGVKMGAKKPMMKKPAAAPAADGEAPSDDEIADIPDLNEVEAAPVAKLAPDRVAYSRGAMGMSIVVQLAACAAMGVLAYWLYKDVELIFAF